MKWVVILSVLFLGGCTARESAVKRAPSSAKTPVPPTKTKSSTVAQPQPTFNPEPQRSETISPDGTLSATSTLRTNPVWTGVVTVRETKSGRVVAKWRVRDGATGLAFSHNNKWLAIGGSNTLTVWDWRAKRVVHVLKLAEEDEQIYPDVQSDFSPDGRVVAVADGQVKLFDTQSWNLIHSFEGKDDPIIVDDVSFSPDGRFVVASNYDADFAHSLVNVSMLKTQDLTAGESREKPIFSRDSRLVALHSTKEGISIWNVRRAKKLSQFIIPDDSDFVVHSFSPDARLLALQNEQGHFEVWRVQDGKRLLVSPSKSDLVRWINSQSIELRSGQTTKRVSIEGAAR